jgi:hypothetical protein
MASGAAGPGRGGRLQQLARGGGRRQQRLGQWTTPGHCAPHAGGGRRETQSRRPARPRRPLGHLVELHGSAGQAAAGADALVDRLGGGEIEVETRRRRRKWRWSMGNWGSGGEGLVYCVGEVGGWISRVWTARIADTPVIIFVLGVAWCKTRLRNYGGDRERGGMSIMEATENEACMHAPGAIHACTILSHSRRRTCMLLGRTVADGCLDHNWARDIRGELSVEAIRGYLNLWGTIQAVPRADGADNSFHWKWTTDGSFSSKSAYLTLFHGTTALPGAANVWNSFAPLKFKLHAWLALRRRCWTADRRRKRGLPTHILCPLCGTSEGTLDHVTLRCPFALAIWTGVVARLRLPNIVPSENAEIGEWWPAAVERFAVADRRTANSFIMLVMRILWLERNARVFERSPTTA